jgi:uncharacterized phiE125 gp8 family phage protein
MSYTLGQQVVLTTLVTDTLGVPTNATMGLVVTKPDGTTLVSGVGLTINTTGTGAYSCVVPTTAAGTWLYLWTASGAAVGVDDGQFDVLAITRRIASLADAKLHMNKQNTADDVEIQDFMDAAQAVITREVGDVVPTTYAETLPIDGCRLILTNRPVLSITTLKVYYSAVAMVTLDPSTYRLDGPTGIVERTGSGGYPIPFTGQGDTADVVYLSGRTGAVPPNIRLAYLELTAHLWRNSQQGRNRRVRGTGPEDDMASVGLGFSLPNRVRELLGPKRPAMF